MLFKFMNVIITSYSILILRFNYFKNLTFVLKLNSNIYVPTYIPKI